MMRSDAPQARRAWVSVVAGILTVANILAAIFGCAMLAWALDEMGYEGEQWGLVGVLFFSSVALAVMLVVLLPGTILLVVLGRKSLRIGLRAFTIIALAVGVLANVAALACIPLNDMARQKRLKSERTVYTSGLYDAVKQGDTAKAESILTGNPEAIGDIPLDMSLLARAVDNNDRAMVELLLKRGADARDGGGGRASPLHVAAVRGNVSIAEVLLRHGADINAEDSDSQKQTPLTYAQSAGQTAMVRFLKSKGASNVNLKSAAWRATYYGKAADLRRVLDQGLDVNVTWPGGTLLHTAAGQGHVDIAGLLIDRGARLDISLGLGTPLHDAAYKGKVEMIKYLIRRGAHVNALEARNYTPLYWAAGNGHIEAVRALLENGADANLGESAMKEAQREGHKAVVALLKQHGAKEQAATAPSGGR